MNATTDSSNEESGSSTQETVEVCQECGAEFDSFLDVVLNAAEHHGPFSQEQIQSGVDSQ
jgi:hypothetical protein